MFSTTKTEKLGITLPKSLLCTIVGNISERGFAVLWYDMRGVSVDATILDKNSDLKGCCRCIDATT